MKTAIIVAILVMFAVPAVAVTYEWEDSQGTINFTEDLGSIPKQYRKKAKVLGAEEEVAPAENGQGDVPGETVTGSGAKEQGKSAEQPAVEKKKTFGGRSADSWKNDFADIDRKIKSEDEHLGDLKSSIQDTSKLSRGEYLSIQLSIKESENRLKRLREKLDTLNSDANRAGVPAELRGH
jgi:hypothetical protein